MVCAFGAIHHFCYLVVHYLSKPVLAWLKGGWTSFLNILLFVVRIYNLKNNRVGNKEHKKCVILINHITLLLVLILIYLDMFIHLL